jgi:hypothetical protein
VISHLYLTDFNEAAVAVNEVEEVEDLIDLDDDLITFSPRIIPEDEELSALSKLKSRSLNPLDNDIEELAEDFEQKLYLSNGHINPMATSNHAPAALTRRAAQVAFSVVNSKSIQKSHHSFQQACGILVSNQQHKAARPSGRNAPRPPPRHPQPVDFPYTTTDDEDDNFQLLPALTKSITSETSSRPSRRTYKTDQLMAIGLSANTKGLLTNRSFRQVMATVNPPKSQGRTEAEDDSDEEFYEKSTANGKTVYVAAIKKYSGTVKPTETLPDLVQDNASEAFPSSPESSHAVVPVGQARQLTSAADNKPRKDDETEGEQQCYDAKSDEYYDASED